MRRAALALAVATAVLGLGAPTAGATPAWLPPTTLSPAELVATRPSVAMDPAGDSVAVWTASNSSGAHVEASSRAAGGTWSAPVVLATESEVGDAEVVLAQSGEATAVWTSGFGVSVVRAATRSPAGSWSEPQTISAPATIASTGGLAIAADGSVTAALAQYEPGGDAVVVVTDRPPGDGWSTPQTISPETPAGCGSPSLAVDERGDAAVVWERGLMQMEGSARPAEGPWSPPIELSGVGQPVGRSGVAIDAGGDAVAVWTRRNPSKYVAQSVDFGPGGRRGIPVDLSAATGDVEYPEVAVDAAGEAVAVWARPDPGPSVVEGATRSPGSSWSAPTTLSPPGQVADFPNLAMGPDGFAVLSWRGETGSMKGTPYGSTRPPGGAWSAPQGLAPDAAPGIYPIAAADAHGDAVTVWESFAGMADQVRAAGFDGAGPQLGAVSIPSSGQVGQPLNFSVAATDVWSAADPPAWLFGDGTIAKGDEVTHGYLNAGDYDISVSVTDALGNVSTAGGKVTIASPASTTSPPRAAAPLGLARAAHTAIVKKGLAALKLSCEGGECLGAVKLYIAPPQGRDRRRRRPVLVGEGTFRIAPAGREVLEVRVHHNALVRLRRAETGHLVTTLSGSGITAGKVSLHEPEPRGRGGRG